MNLLRPLIFWCLLWWSCVGNFAAAAPVLSSNAYWVDHTGTATWREAREAHYTDYQRTLQLGYTPSAVWVKLSVSGLSEGEPFVLLTGPSFVQSVRLYDPTLPEGGVQQSGSSTSLADASFQGVSNGFVVAPGGTMRTLYLRIQSSTSVIVDLKVFSQPVAEKADSLRVEGLVFYLGFLFLTAMWGLIHWFIQRDALYGYFSVRQLYALLHVICYTGLLRYWGSDVLGASVREHIYNVVIITILPFYGLFETRLLKDFGTSRRLRALTQSVIAVCLVSLGLLAVGWVREALRLNIFVVMIFTVTLALTAMTARGSPQALFNKSSVWVIRVGYLLFAVTAFLPVLSFDAIIPAHWLILDILILPSAVSSILMLILLSIRTRQQEAAFQDARVNEALIQSRLAIEQDRRREKEGFLAMLTHELRNPLSVIRMRTDADTHDGRAVQKAAVDMAMVLERVQQSERQDAFQEEPTEVEFDLASLLDEVVMRSGQGGRIKIGGLRDKVVKSDRQLLDRMLFNLIDNAIKYGRQEADIQVDVRADSAGGREGIRFTVSNLEGEAGAPDPAQVFAKYYRAPGAHRAIGSGLGLYLISQWVRFLKGSVEYSRGRSADDEPLVIFSVWIPQ